MAIEITIPRLGWNMEEGIFVGWLKQDGDPVGAGDPLFSLEGEKATQDVEAIDDGHPRIAGEHRRGRRRRSPSATIVGYLVGAGEADPAQRAVPPRRRPSTR